MNFIGQMRLGSVEVLSALALFIGLAGRHGAKVVPSDRSAAAQRVAVEINDRGSVRLVEGFCPFTIGRGSSADLVLADLAISRIHARLDNDGEAVFLSDLSSSNGTYLNGERITESIELRGGDTIDIGVVRLTYLGAQSWE